MLRPNQLERFEVDCVLRVADRHECEHVVASFGLLRHDGGQDGDEHAVQRPPAIVAPRVLHVVGDAARGETFGVLGDEVALDSCPLIRGERSADQVGDIARSETEVHGLPVDHCDRWCVGVAPEEEVVGAEVTMHDRLWRAGSHHPWNERLGEALEKGGDVGVEAVTESFDARRHAMSVVLVEQLGAVATGRLECSDVLERAVAPTGL